MALPVKIARVVSEELEKAFYETGKRILSLYLEDLTHAQVVSSLHSTNKLRQIVDLILQEELRAEYGTLPPAPANPSQPRSKSADSSPPRPRPPYPRYPLVPPRRVVLIERTRQMMTAIEEYLEHPNSPPQIPAADAVKIVKERTGHTITSGSLLAAIQRTRDYHKIVVRWRKPPVIQLRSDLLVELLERRYKLSRLGRANKVISMSRKEQEQAS